MTSVSTNTNIASTVASSLSSLKLNNAARAFTRAQRPVEEVEKELQTQEVQDRKLLDDNSAILNMLTPSAIQEMREISSTMGEELTDEDIQYALKYGRSVIADYSV